MMRLFLLIIFLIAICNLPVYGVMSSSIILNSTSNSTDANSMLSNESFSMELKMKNCQKNATENCQIIGSKLDNINGTTLKIIQEVKQDENYSLWGLIVAVFSLGVAISIFFIQDRQGKKLKKLVDRVHDFTEKQISIMEAKRKMSSKFILFNLRFIEYEIDGIAIQQRFRDSRNYQDMNDLDRKNQQIKYYENAQKIFQRMDLEFDEILAVFNEKTEKQYRQAWSTISRQSIYVNFDNSEKTWETINKIRQEFANLKDLLIDFAEDKDKSTYSGLFDPEKFKKDSN